MNGEEERRRRRRVDDTVAALNASAEAVDQCDAPPTRWNSDSSRHLHHTLRGIERRIRGMRARLSAGVCLLRGSGVGHGLPHILVYIRGE